MILIIIIILSVLLISAVAYLMLSGSGSTNTTTSTGTGTGTGTATTTVTSTGTGTTVFDVQSPVPTGQMADIVTWAEGYNTVVAYTWTVPSNFISFASDVEFTPSWTSLGAADFYVMNGARTATYYTIGSGGGMVTRVIPKATALTWPTFTAGSTVAAVVSVYPNTDNVRGARFRLKFTYNR